MTRKEAIFEAIRLVKVSKLKVLQKREIVEKLELCQLELPFAHWTEAAIFDACDQFIAEKGRPLWVNDFDQYAELPSHPTIQNRFGMTARQFRDTYYPLPPEERPDSDQRVEKMLADFKAELARCGAHTREEYDDLRDRSLPCSTTLLRRAGLSCWRELLSAVGTTPEAIKRRRTPQAFAASFRLEHEGKVFEEDMTKNYIA